MKYSKGRLNDFNADGYLQAAVDEHEERGGLRLGRGLDPAGQVARGAGGVQRAGVVEQLRVPAGADQRGA